MYKVVRCNDSLRTWKGITKSHFVGRVKNSMEKKQLSIMLAPAYVCNE